MSAEPRWVFISRKRWDYWLPNPHCPTMGKVLGRVHRKGGSWHARVHAPGVVKPVPYADLEKAKQYVARVVAQRGFRATEASQ